MDSWLPYLPVVSVAVFLNTADIYFMQSDRFPQFQRAPSYWLYMVGHALVGLGSAYLLYRKTGFQSSDWPIVTMVASLAGFSLLQSWTLKFGDKGIDARDLFDAWKRRVIEDVSQSNTSRKRERQMRVARQLTAKESANPGRLDGAILQLAPSVQADGQALLAGFSSGGADASLSKAQWIASVDLDFAQALAELP